jgi:hypothetical protein
LKSAGNDSHATVLEQAFGPFDLQRGLAWVFGGYLGVTILGLVVGPRVFKKELVRLSALGVYAVAARLLDALVAECILHALSDHFLALAGVGTLVVFAAGVPTEALQALFGIAGTGIALLALIILGNPATGVAFSPAMLPGFWRAIGFWLPPDARVRAETGAVYFQGHATLGALAVLAVYAAVGTAVALIVGGRRRPA